jgi:D-alanyl-D-alanine carboxypeptidase/D-alanyl-D-alanine-endopeptidase (penicillin-binding protein 4)
VGAPAAGSPSAAALPDPAKLATALRPALTDRGLAGPVGMQVRDLATGTVLFDQAADKPDVPASTAKLLTAAVALDRLGPRTRLQTRVFAAGDVLYLVGGGDPTLTRATTGALGARVDDLARQVRAAGVTRASRVVADATFFSGPTLAPGWQPYYLNAEIGPVSALSVDAGRRSPSVKATARTPNPSPDAANTLRGALSRAGVRVDGVGAGRVPAGARQVAMVESPTVADLVKRMLTYSDNDLAESLGRQLAHAAGRPADFNGEVAAVADGLQTLGLPLDGLRMFDSSGLSHGDLVPPSLLVEVLRAAADPARPQLRPILDGLPVAGRTGTLADRFRTPETAPAVGLVHAKSGRLAGVAALAGTARTRSGQVLVFSVRAPSVDLTVGEKAMDRIAATLTRCGCR